MEPWTKFNRIVNKTAYKATDDLFALVAQDDFNPDTVLAFGADSYVRGLVHMSIAHVIAFVIGTAIGVVSNFIKERKAK